MLVVKTVEAGLLVRIQDNLQMKTPHTWLDVLSGISVRMSNQFKLSAAQRLRPTLRCSGPSKAFTRLLVQKPRLFCRPLRSDV
jgi:hypothetical protein